MNIDAPKFPIKKCRFSIPDVAEQFIDDEKEKNFSVFFFVFFNVNEVKKRPSLSNFFLLFLFL
jgi:hypothetical protein